MPGSFSFARVLSLSWAVFVVPLSGCLLWSCATLDGAVFGMAAMALGVAPVLWIRGQGRETPWRRRGVLACLSLWLVMTCWLAWRQPNGHPRSASPVCNRYVGGGWHYDRMALGTLLPEVDQFMLGFKLMPALDPLLTTRQAGTLSALTRTIYAELEADPDFHALGSVMPNAYRELRGQRFDDGHYLLYVPPKLDMALPAPALVFLHGSGGNFKAYTWLLSRIADGLALDGTRSRRDRFFVSLCSGRIGRQFVGHGCIRHTLAATRAPDPPQDQLRLVVACLGDSLGGGFAGVARPDLVGAAGLAGTGAAVVCLAGGSIGGPDFVRFVVGGQTPLCEFERGAGEVGRAAWPAQSPEHCRRRRLPMATAAGTRGRRHPLVVCQHPVTALGGGGLSGGGVVGAGEGTHAAARAG